MAEYSPNIFPHTDALSMEINNHNQLLNGNITSFSPFLVVCIKFMSAGSYPLKAVSRMQVFLQACQKLDPLGWVHAKKRNVIF